MVWKNDEGHEVTEQELMLRGREAEGKKCEKEQRLLTRVGLEHHQSVPQTSP